VEVEEEEEGWGKRKNNIVINLVKLIMKNI
jgi:hypothetical protein